MAAAGKVVQMDRDEVLTHLRQVPMFAKTDKADLQCFDHAEVVDYAAGDVLVEQGSPGLYFWILLQGELQATAAGEDGQRETIATVLPNETCGEVPLLAGTINRIDLEAVTPSRVVRLNDQGFWQMMTACRSVRQAILGNMARRIEGMHAMLLQREKMASLGTMAAGLMHELNNPGAAARRAASQLRENLLRLQEVGMRLSHEAMTEEQRECLGLLQERAMRLEKPKPLGSLEESDAEEAMAEWLEEQGISDAWKMAPTLVGMGITRDEIACAQNQFSGDRLADALRWLEALVSSLQLVGTVEESITRVVELVMAVKRYAYEGKAAHQQVDVNESIASTLVILAHKLRNKEIDVVKEFAGGLPLVSCSGAGLGQVWTNLIDNAIDASSPRTSITLRTGKEGDNVVVTVADKGSGIPEEHQKHVFEPFYTTKPAGVGTGLGLDIVRRIVDEKLHGSVNFTSTPAGTEFVVRIPVTPNSDGAANDAAAAGGIRQGSAAGKDQR